MADPVLNGKYIKELDELTSIAIDAWIAFQPDAVSDQAYRISFENFISTIAGESGIADEYDNIDDLLAAQSSQAIGDLYHVLDPIADPAFNDLPDAEIKSVYYHLSETKTGSLNNYNSIAFPKLGSDKNAKLGNSLDAFTFDIKFRAAEWSSNQATLQAAANALDLNSPQDLKLTGESVKLITGNDPTEISRVLFGLDGQLIFEPIEASKIQSDSDATDITLNDSYQEILSITGNQNIALALANIGLTAKSFTTGSITAFADASDGRITATSATHGHSEGDFIEIVNTTNYDGIYEIKSVPNINDFDITKAFVATETGDWEKSANREIAIDLRVNEISVKEFTRQIEGEGRLNFSEQLSSLVSGEDVDVWAKSNTAGEAIEILGTTQSSELKVISSDSDLEDGSGTTINTNKVDLGGVLSILATIRKNNNIAYQILKQAAGDDGEFQQFIMSNTEFWQHYSSVAGDLNIQIGMEKSGAGVQAGGGLYMYVQPTSGATTAGMNFGKTGIIKVGDVTGAGRAIGSMYDSDYHAKWELLSAAERKRIQPDIEWVELNAIPYKELYVNQVYAGGDSDGTQQRPFTDAQDAIGIAETSSRYVIHIGAGIYTTDLVIGVSKHLSFVGINTGEGGTTNTHIKSIEIGTGSTVSLKDLIVTDGISTGVVPTGNITIDNVWGDILIGSLFADLFINRLVGDVDFQCSDIEINNSKISGQIQSSGYQLITGGTESTVDHEVITTGRIEIHNSSCSGDITTLGALGTLTIKNSVASGVLTVSQLPIVYDNQAGELEKQAIGATLAIPFNKLITKIAPLTITGATEFTVNTTDAEYGNLSYRRVTADGTNIPTHASPFQKWLASRDYDNTNGTVNVIAYWFDGVSYYYSWGQAEPLDTQAPSFASAEVGNIDDTTIRITMDEACDPASTPATTAFTPAGIASTPTVTVVNITGVFIDLTLSAAVVDSDTPTIAYTKPGSNFLKDTSDNETDSWTAELVTNNVSADTPDIILGAKLEFWFDNNDASKFTLEDTDRIQAQAESGSNGYSRSCATSTTERPTLTAGEVVFDGVANLLNLSSIPNEVQGEFFFVAKLTDTNVRLFACGEPTVDDNLFQLNINQPNAGKNGSIDFYLYDQGIFSNNFYGDTDLQGDTGYHIFNLSTEGTNYRARIDATEQTLTDVSALLANGNWFDDITPLNAIFGAKNNNNLWQFSDHIEVEVIYANEELTTQERTDMFTYLNDKHSIY